MHQSIPAVPIPPGNHGTFAHVTVRVVGHWPGGWALAYPETLDTRVFEDGRVYREGRGLYQRQSFPPNESNRTINLCGEHYVPSRRNDETYIFFNS